LYGKKIQPQLDEWKAERKNQKAKASDASADAQLELNKDIKELEGKIHEGGRKLAKLSAASDDAWESIKDGFQEDWESVKTGLQEATSKFKR
jgi:predicted  nucleic acid-binding Zn-ribbon protein